MINIRAFARPAILPRFFSIRKAERQIAQEGTEKQAERPGFFAQFEAMMSHASAPLIKSLMEKY